MRFRSSEAHDVAEMMAIRNGVRENRLVSRVIGEDDYRAAMAEGGTWVCEVDGAVVGFACGRPSVADVWALFVDEGHEGRGIGGGLMDRVEGWMFAQGLGELRLTTAPGTRAERLYRRRGWREVGRTAAGEIAFVLRR